MPSRAVLFDFDGTLADTAPDLAAAVNRMRVEQGYEPLPLERLRPFASAGARGLLQAAFGIKPDDAEYKAMRQEFLDLYAETCCGQTRLFPGIAELSARARARDIRWGVVTNKATRFTERILAHLSSSPTASRAATPRRTSSPIPLRCCTPPSSSACRRRPAATSATTCAT